MAALVGKAGQEMMITHAYKVARDARTGRFRSIVFALAHKATTVIETVRR